MIIAFLVVFVLAMLFNFYTTIWGKQDLEKLKGKISFGKYLKEMNEGLQDAIGDVAATIVKICFCILVVIIVFVNFWLCLACLLALVLGTWAAKKAYQIPAVSNVLNKIATYINRLR